jgi:hypothetical protein
VFELLTRTQLPPELEDAREQLCPYKRQALRLAYQAGWNTAPHQATLLGLLKSDLMSDLGKSAVYAGAEARLALDVLNREENDGKRKPASRGG